MTTDDPQKIKARLNDVAADVRDVYQDAVCCIADLQCQVSDLRVDRDHLKDVCKELTDANEALQGERDEFEAKQHHLWDVKEAIRVENFELWSKNERLEAENAALKAKLARDFPCCDAPDEQQEPERLTVADLEAAPVGSVLTSATGSRFGQKYTKESGNHWRGDLNPTATPSSQWLADQPYLSHATLTYPTPAPVTAETIRASEPGTTYEDEDGDVLEWDGEKLRADLHKPHYGSGDMLKADDLLPLTRSSAAPRGDYGKPEVPSGHSVQIDPAVYETMFSDQKFLARLHDEIRTAKVVTDD